jgi:Ribbon-helix-helix protein, copG family.
MGTSQKKKVYGLSLDTDLIDDLDKLAQKVGLSRSAFINFVLRQQRPITVYINEEYQDDLDHQEEPIEAE